MSQRIGPRIESELAGGDGRERASKLAAAAVPLEKVLYDALGGVGRQRAGGEPQSPRRRLRWRGEGLEIVEIVEIIGAG